MQAPVVASIHQAPSGFAQHWVMPVMQFPPWNAHAYSQASQAVEFGDRVWMGGPQAHAAQWQRVGCPTADRQFSRPPSDDESTKAPSSPRSVPDSGYVLTDSHNSSLLPTLNSTDPPWHRQPSTEETHSSLGHRPDTLAYGLSADAESHVSVVLSGLPKMLCSAKCLEVAVEQACHESDVVNLEVKITRGVGEAVLVLRTERAAQQCIRHFTGLRCARSRPIVARYNAEAGKRLMARSNATHSVRDEPASQEPEASNVAPNLHKQARPISTSRHQSALELNTLAICKTEGEVAATSRPRELVTCEGIAKTAAPTNGMVLTRPPVAPSPKPSVIDSPMKSKRFWVDYDDDADDDEDGFYLGWQSTLAPPESEASAFWSSDTESS